MGKKVVEIYNKVENWQISFSKVKVNILRHFFTILEVDKFLYEIGILQILWPTKIFQLVAQFTDYFNWLEVLLNPPPLYPL